jgi:chromosome segregation ATPase
MKLGAAVSSDLEALKADLENARALAAEYQLELSGKSNELAKVKELFEKTRRHLIQLQISVTQLRDERHRLANRVMEAESEHRKLEQVTAERDRLHQKLDALQVWQD